MGLFLSFDSKYLSLFSLVLLVFIFFVSSISKTLTRPIEVANQAFKNFANGNFKAFDDLEILKDDRGILLSNLKQMSEQMTLLLRQRAQKARIAILGEIAGNIAHEINNPLQVISIRLELILKELQKGHDIKKIENNIEVANKTVFRISKIIKGLKALSREGEADPFLPVTVQELVDNAMVLCQGSLRHSLVDLQFVSDVPSFQVECRSFQIIQVLLNLINNAHDAIADNQERWIRLSVEVIGNNVLFKVRNSGPKISQELVKNIFDPFYTTKKSGYGTGLGLSISIQIAKEHQGNLYVDLDDEQTCFVLKISAVCSSQA